MSPFNFADTPREGPRSAQREAGFRICGYRSIVKKIVIPTSHNTVPAGLTIANTEVDLLVVGGSGTGLAAALAAHEQGLSVLVVEKSSHVGGSTARSGGGRSGCRQPGHRRMRRVDTATRAQTYLDSVVAAPHHKSARQRM